MARTRKLLIEKREGESTEGLAKERRTNIKVEEDMEVEKEERQSPATAGKTTSSMGSA